MTDTPSSKDLNKISRRQFFGLVGLATAGVVVASSTYLYLNNESDTLSIEKITLPIAGLAPALEGFRIAQLSDIHLYPLTPLDLVERAVALTNQLQPDLTVLTGDFVWRDVDAIFDLAPVINKLQARHGVYAIRGNHEIWTDPAAIQAGFAETNIPLLVNEGVTITEGNGSLFLAGLDDGWSGEPDLDTAVTNAPKDAPIILLMHEPDLADQYSLDPHIALQLAGHSHGGQVRLPRRGALILPYLARKYDMGLYRVRDMWLYTNRGIGVTNEPFRYNCQPEITEITLTRL